MTAFCAGGVFFLFVWTWLRWIFAPLQLSAKPHRSWWGRLLDSHDDGVSALDMLAIVSTVAVVIFQAYALVWLRQPLNFVDFAAGLAVPQGCLSLVRGIDRHRREDDAPKPPQGP